MNMIRYHDSNMQVELPAVVVEAAFQHNGTHALWKNPPVSSAESYKVRLVVTLKMRELSAVKSLRH